MSRLLVYTSVCTHKKKGVSMKKISLVLFMLCFAMTAYAAEKNLHEMFEDYPHIKLYLKDVTNEAKDPHVKVNVFRDVARDALKERVNIKFVPVDSLDEADVVVTAKIKQYVFTEKALPSIFGAAALAADTATPKSSAKLTVDYELTSPTGKVLMKHKDFTTEARLPVQEMRGEKAFKHAVDKNVNRFLYRSFREQQDGDIPPVN